MKKFLIFLFFVFILASCCGCTSLHMALDGLDHAEIDITHSEEV